MATDDIKQEQFSSEECPPRRSDSAGLLSRVTNTTVPPSFIQDEATLAALSATLAARGDTTLTQQETALLYPGPTVPHSLVSCTLRQIEEGGDPLGEAFGELRSAAQRRQDGAVYTPSSIVKTMLTWAETLGPPDRVVDPGAGSGRFSPGSWAALPQRLACCRGARPVGCAHGPREPYCSRHGEPVRGEG